MKEKENTAATTKATKDLVLSTLTTIHSGICFEERKKQFQKHSFRGFLTPCCRSVFRGIIKYLSLI